MSANRALYPVALLIALLTSPAMASAPGEVPFEVLQQRERGSDHFTQGLYFDGKHWWESSGRYQQSWLAKYTDPSKAPLRRKWLSPDRFAEGLAVLGDRLYLLTYRAGELQVYRASTLQRLGTYHYAGEGWGLTSDGQWLIMSNGSDQLTFRDPDTFEIKRRLQVHGGDQRWARLNELEYAQGLIWANIWMDERIIAIDPASGEVQGVLDISELSPAHNDVDAVANGIAWDPENDGLWVTGKYWKQLYLIRPEGLGFGAGPAKPDSEPQPR